MDLGIDGRVAIVTGGSKGIGAATARLLAAEGARLVLGARDRDGMATRAELAERYQERTGFDVSHVRYYEVVSLFKLACILEGHYTNALKAGGLVEPRLADSAPSLFADALRIAEGRRGQL